MTEAIPVVEDPTKLLRLGILKVQIPSIVLDESESWAAKLTRATPMIMAAQGDNEYAFYRNIMEDPDLGFPLSAVLADSIEDLFFKHFGVTKEELRMDDAFCVHYNMDQGDTSGAKHIDPSDFTINLCLEKSDNVEGSHVMFYGSKKLNGINDHEYKTPEFRFLVPQKAGYATIHFGDHPHETTPLLKGGRRTNTILTYCYIDESKSDVKKRSCYFD